MNSTQNRYLSFSLGVEEYAIPLLSVKEVIAVPETTPIPSAPSYFLGLMNLRGQVISVIDLRQKLSIKPLAGTETAVIICDLSPLTIGIVVDSINSVLTPKDEDISSKPEIQNSRNTSYVVGVYQTDHKLVLLLDVAKALSVEELQATMKNAHGAVKAA